MLSGRETAPKVLFTQGQIVSLVNVCGECCGGSYYELRLEIAPVEGAEKALFFFLPKAVAVDLLGKRKGVLRS